MVYVLWSSHHGNAYIGGHDIRQKKGHVTIHQHGPNMGIEFLYEFRLLTMAHMISYDIQDNVVSHGKSNSTNHPHVCDMFKPDRDHIIT